jgi:GNAT superfamily N-acetyltransferase
VQKELMIRAARPEDDIRCGQIIAAASMASDLPDRLPHARDMFDDAAPLSAEGRYRLIAELPDFVAGFADYNPARRHVRYLFVDPDLQGLGIGGALLDEAQRLMGGIVNLHCLAANVRSARWYQAHGFQVIARYRGPLCGRQVGWLRLRRR